MGYMVHHAIIVTSWDKKEIKTAHYSALVIFQYQVSSIVQSEVNGYFSFLIGPDGSNEGWRADLTGNINRSKFINSLKDFPSIKFVEIQYADDEGNNQLVRGN